MTEPKLNETNLSEFFRSAETVPVFAGERRMSNQGVAGAVARSARQRGAVWEEVSCGVIEHEDRLSREDAAEKWNSIFRLFGASGESAQAEVKLAIYAYYAVNGASRRTKHSRDINTGGGDSVLAADVGSLIGFERIRQFLRSDVDEAYCALKESAALERDEVFVQKATEKGVPRGYVHCAVDFLRGCSLMTPEESAYAERHFNYSIQRARAARGGVTVDEEDDRNRGVGLDRRREESRVSRVSGVEEL